LPAHQRLTFGKIIIPQSVFDELQRPRTPHKVKDWVSNHPVWLEAQQANLTTFTPRKKNGQGEREVFALALDINATAVLLDDRGAMVEARRHNISTIPTFPSSNRLRPETSLTCLRP